MCTRGSVAEWSKALVLGTSPKGRGFESHRCQRLFFAWCYSQGPGWNPLSPPKSFPQFWQVLRSQYEILCWHTNDLLNWGSSSVVERPLRMRKAWGSIPHLSILVLHSFLMMKKILTSFTNRTSSLVSTKNGRARPGIEPGTSRTRSANHTPRPTSHPLDRRLPNHF